MKNYKLCFETRPFVADYSDYKKRSCQETSRSLTLCDFSATGHPHMTNKKLFLEADDITASSSSWLRYDLLSLKE